MNLVLCEGKEDALLLAALAIHLGLRDRLDFESYAGTSKLRPNLSNLRVKGEYTSGELRRLLVTRDADTDPDGAWNALTDAIRSALGIEVTQAGQWESTPGSPEVAGWLIPARHTVGMIESLCLTSARERQPEIFACLDRFAECLTEQRGAEPHPKEVFAYWTICGQDQDPRKRLSIERALSHLPFDWDSPVFSGLSAVLREAAE